MQEKLSRLYYFLLANDKYNKELQEKEYKKMLLPHDKAEDKVVALLYGIVNTQSQPKVDRVAHFFENLVQEHYSKLGSFNGLLEALGAPEGSGYDGLFISLRDSQGWGKKTAALFTKVIINAHSGRYCESVRIWDDAPRLSSDDKVYLPVDAVILDIFANLGLSKVSFDSINKTLRNSYTPDEMIIWDDLWFWGFVNQKGSGKNRASEWNRSKYWVLPSSNKQQDIIREVEKHSEVFRYLVAPTRT